MACAAEEFLKELELKADQCDCSVVLFEAITDCAGDDEDSQAEGQTQPQPLTLEQLRCKKHAFVTRACASALHRIVGRMDSEGAPDGFQSTSTCASMYRVFASELRRANHSFDNLLALTLAFKDDMGLYCFHDTDVPDEAQKLLSRFGKLWQDAIRAGLPLDESSKEGVMFVLQQFQESILEMGADYKFTFEPCTSTPVKRRRASGASTPTSAEKPPQKRPRQSHHPPVSQDVCSLCTFLDDPSGMATERGAAFQLRCTMAGGVKKEAVIIVGGKCRLWKLNQTIAECFNVGEGEFHYEPMKGKTVLGSHFKVYRPLAPGKCGGVMVCSSQSAKQVGGYGNSVDDKKYNVAQLFRGASTGKALQREPAEAALHVVFHSPRLDREVDVVLDGIMLDSYDSKNLLDKNRRSSNSMHLPRIVGSSFLSDRAQDAKNAKMLGSREPARGLLFKVGESQASINRDIRRWMRFPLFCKNGSDAPDDYESHHDA